MIIADTNVVSEFMKDESAPAVLSWAQGHPAADLIICVVTVEEIERGLGRLPAGNRRQSLTRRWHEIIDAFSESIAIYDLAAARTTATVVAEAEEGGHPMGLVDAQIAGICVSGSNAASHQPGRPTQYARPSESAIDNWAVATPNISRHLPGPHTLTIGKCGLAADHQA